MTMWIKQLVRMVVTGETPPITRDQDVIRETSRLRIEQREVRQKFHHELDRVDQMFMRMASNGRGDRK